MSTSKVAIITGGASGLGLAVADVFSRKGWRVHIFDLNEPNKNAEKGHSSNLVFRKVDVASWDSLSSSFDAVFKAEGRLDFVFANAGIMERGKFFERHEKSLPPPEPDELSIDVNLKGVIKTSYLAQHYFRANANGGKDCTLVMTSSIAGIVSPYLRVVAMVTPPPHMHPVSSSHHTVIRSGQSRHIEFYALSSPYPLRGRRHKNVRHMSRIRADELTSERTMGCISAGILNPDGKGDVYR